MEHKIQFNMFSQEEDSYYKRFQLMRDRFFEPVCTFLTRGKIKPDFLSYLNIFLGVVIALLVRPFPVLAFVFLLLTVFIDSVDGCLARHQNCVSGKGALLDIASDHFVFFGILLALISMKTVDGFFGAAYGLNYLLLLVLIIPMRSLNLHVFPVIRSKFLLYFLWALLIFTGINFLDLFLLFFAVYMFLTNLFLFHQLRCSLP
jgi:phosphatidylglycerophosphate synthase